MHEVAQPAASGATQACRVARPRAPSRVLRCSSCSSRARSGGWLVVLHQLISIGQQVRGCALTLPRPAEVPPQQKNGGREGYDCGDDADDCLWAKHFELCSMSVVG